MGFSVSATMAIFFATFLILFSILYASVNDAFDKVSESFDDRYDYMSEKVQTELEVVSVSYSKLTGELDIVVKNTGSVPLGINNTRVLVNGTVISPQEIGVSGATTNLWLPLESLTITISSPNTSFDPSVIPRTCVRSDAGLSGPANISVGESVFIVDGTDIDVLSFDGLLEFTITDNINLLSPTDLKVCNDYLYVLDEGTHIDRFDLDGNWVDRFVNDSANTSAPSSFAADSEYIYIVDGGSHLDRYNRTTGNFVDQLIPNGGAMTAPRDVYVSTYIYVVDYAAGSYHVDRYSLDGTGGSAVVGSGNLGVANDISASSNDGGQGRLYVLNNSEEILVFDEDGSYLGVISEGLSDSAVGVDVSGKIFVSDFANGLVVENLGTSIKVVTENGVSEVALL